MSAAAIAALGLTKLYAGKPVLQGASGVFRQGELTAILGKRGAGRTTLAAILAGQRLADAGRVWRSGSVAPLVGHSAGFGATGSIRRDLGLRAAAAGLCGRRFAAAVAAELGAPALLDRSFERLEGPSRAALCHAAAWLVPADIYIADGALNPNGGPGAEAIAARLAERRRHAAVIWLTAGVTSLRAAAPDRILLLERGMLRPLADIEEAIAVFDERRRPGAARSAPAQPAPAAPPEPPVAEPPPKVEATAASGKAERPANPAAEPGDRTREGSSAVLSAGTVLRLSPSDVAPTASIGTTTTRPESQPRLDKPKPVVTSAGASKPPCPGRRGAAAQRPEALSAGPKPPASTPTPSSDAQRQAAGPSSDGQGRNAEAEAQVSPALPPAYRTLFKGRRPRAADAAMDDPASAGTLCPGSHAGSGGQAPPPPVTVSAAPPGAPAP